MSEAEHLSEQGEPFAGACFDDVVAIARQAYERGKDGFIRSCRAANEWYTDADAHARGLMSVTSDLRDVFFHPQYYGIQAPAPFRPAAREKVARLVRQAMFADREVQELPFGQRVAAMQEVSDATADAIIALSAAPRDGGGWRPIATAPKNQRVLIYCVHPSGGCDQTAMAYQSALDGLWLTMPDERLADFAPTHWRSLPSPPSCDAGGGMKASAE